MSLSIGNMARMNLLVNFQSIAAPISLSEIIFHNRTIIAVSKTLSYFLNSNVIQTLDYMYVCICVKKTWPG